jgi:subtilisin family serine protease
MQQAYDYACQQDVIIIIASGNQGTIGSTSLFNHPWIIPVAMCDEQGNFVTQSNFGPTIGKQGLMAPGVNIKSTSPTGKYTKMTGTSFSAPFVTGTVGLLWSIFPNATAAEIVNCTIKSASNSRRSIIPPLLNAEAAFNLLNQDKIYQP